MNRLEFKEYVKSYSSLFKSENEPLEKFERDGALLSLSFCICYVKLLEDRMRYCMTCGEYYRAVYDKSSWLMKPFVLRRAMQFERDHYETLGRLIQLRTYMKVYHDYKTQSTL